MFLLPSPSFPFSLSLSLSLFSVYRLSSSLHFLSFLLSHPSSDDVEKTRGRREKRYVDKEETTVHTCVFHGLMMHGEAKQNRQQSVFCLTHYMLRGRMGYVYIARVRE